MSGDLIHPPWTAEQVTNLNAFQHCGAFHPFTCRNDECRSGDPDFRSRYASLVAQEDGWLCKWCGYRQNWAHRGMDDPQWVDYHPWWLS